jgi:hypothetical protein
MEVDPMVEPKARLSVRSLFVVTTGLFWLSVLGLAVGLPVGIASTLASDHPMSIHATVSAEQVGGLAAEIGSGERVSLSLPIDHLSAGQIVLFHAVIALAGIVVLYALWQLRQLVGSIRANDPFSTANVRRLRVLGWLLLLAYPSFQYVMGGVSEWILSTGGPSVPSARVDADPFSLGAAFGGLCLLVLAEVFAHGIRLRKDVEATI